MQSFVQPFYARLCRAVSWTMATQAGCANGKAAATLNSQPISPSPSYSVVLAKNLDLSCCDDQREGLTGPLPPPSNCQTKANFGYSCTSDGC